MKIAFSSNAWADYQSWIESDKRGLIRLNELIKDTMRSSFVGLGKPEPLVGTTKGWRSRRITREHRLIYGVFGSGAERCLEILACRRHHDN